MLSRLHRRLTRTWSRLQGAYVKRHLVAPLLASVDRQALVLEIGGGYNPRFIKRDYPNVHHLDHCSAEALRAKYATDPQVAHLIDRIQPIDFIATGAPIDTLVPPALRFDVVFGSHVIEHQVDLIGHLQSLERLLKPDGQVIEIIPDLRRCFDALRYPSVTADVLLPYLRPEPTHRGKQVFDYVARTIDQNPGAPLSTADCRALNFRHPLASGLQAMRAAEATDQPYVDTHAWTFTPQSFRLLMIELRLLGLIRLEAVSVSPTYGNQFCAVLQPAPVETAQLPPTALQALERERLALSIELRPRG